MNTTIHRTVVLVSVFMVIATINSPIASFAENTFWDHTTSTWLNDGLNSAARLQTDRAASQTQIEPAAISAKDCEQYNQELESKQEQERLNPRFLP